MPEFKPNLTPDDLREHMNSQHGVGPRLAGMRRIRRISFRRRTNLGRRGMFNIFTGAELQTIKSKSFDGSA